MTGEQRDYWFVSLEMHLRHGSGAREALVQATVDTARVFSIGPERCEHDVRDGEWCEECNKDYKLAQVQDANP
jgi:hypothetical protein